MKLMMKEATDLNFQETVLQSPKTVLVDFWAPWCGPCQMLGPILEEVAQQVDDGIEIVKMNIDENPMVPGHLGIRSIPTLVLFRGGQGVAVSTGVRSAKDILHWIEEHRGEQA